jgi:hypothetical protein
MESYEYIYEYGYEYKYKYEIKQAIATHQCLLLAACCLLLAACCSNKLGLRRQSSALINT